MEKKTIPIQYVGEIPCTIAGKGKIMPGQTVEVAAQLYHNLIRDRNWKIPAPIAPVSPVEISGADGLDGLDISDESKEKKKSKGKRQEES